MYHRYHYNSSKIKLVKTQGHRNKNANSELLSTHCGFNPFLGSFINSHEIKIGLPTFAPFFHHFFKTKYFFQKLKALERDKVVFSFLLFFSKCVGDYTVLLSSCIPKRVVQKASYFFLYYYHCFLDSKMRFHFTFFIYFFFLLSIYPLAK